MQWSKLKQRVEANLAASVKGKVSFFTTAYRKPDSTTGRGSILVEGEEVVNFSTMDSGRVYGRFYNATTPNNSKRWATHPAVDDAERASSNLVERGEFSRFDLHICMFESLNIAIDQMLTHDSPIVQVLGILDARTGKRRLAKLQKSELGSLATFFLDYRIEAEKNNAEGP